jgi:hypothetical protein
MARGKRMLFSRSSEWPIRYKSMKQNSEMVLTVRPKRIRGAKHPSTDPRIKHLEDCWKKETGQMLIDPYDARAVPARAARRILAPSQNSNLGVLFYINSIVWTEKLVVPVRARAPVA